MATMVTDLIDPAELIGYARDFNREIAENQFSLKRWFPSNTTESLEFAIETSARIDVDAAEFRAFDTPPPMTGRQGFSRKRGKIPPLGRAWPVTEEETLRLNALDAGNLNNRLIDAVYDDTDNAMRSIASRLAVAQGDVLVDGILTLAENNLQLTADFGMPGTHKVTAGVAWTVANAATAVPITDLLAWQEVLATDAAPADVMLLSRSKLSALMVNAQIRAFAASNGTTPPRVNQAQINDIFLSEGLPRVEVFDEKARIRGVQTRLIPDSYTILLPDPGQGALGETLYGVTAEAIALVDGGFIARKDLAGAVAVVIQEQMPITTYTMGNALALPILGDVNAHIAANIG